MPWWYCSHLCEYITDRQPKAAAQHRYPTASGAAAQDRSKVCTLRQRLRFGLTRCVATPATGFKTKVSRAVKVWKVPRFGKLCFAPCPLWPHLGQRHGFFNTPLNFHTLPSLPWRSYVQPHDTESTSRQFKPQLVSHFLFMPNMLT